MTEEKICKLEYYNLTEKEEDTLQNISDFNTINSCIYFVDADFDRLRDYYQDGLSKKLIKFLARMNNKGFRYVGFEL